MRASKGARAVAKGGGWSGYGRDIACVIDAGSRYEGRGYGRGERRVHVAVECEEKRYSGRALATTEGGVERQRAGGARDGEEGEGVGEGGRCLSR